MSNVAAVSARRFAGVRAILAVAALLSTTACYAWRVETVTPRSVFDGVDRVHLTKVDGSSVAVVAPRIENDSVVGTWAGSSTRIAVPVSEVRTIKVRRFSSDRTVLVIVGVAGGVAVLAKAIHDEASKPYDICPTGCLAGFVP